MTIEQANSLNYASAFSRPSIVMLTDPIAVSNAYTVAAQDSSFQHLLQKEEKKNITYLRVTETEKYGEEPYDAKEENTVISVQPIKHHSDDADIIQYVALQRAIMDERIKKSSKEEALNSTSMTGSEWDSLLDVFEEARDDIKKAIGAYLDHLLEEKLSEVNRLNRMALR